MSHGVNRGSLKSGKIDEREVIINKLIKYNESLDKNNINPESKLFNDSIIDSVSFIELIIDIQKQFEFEFNSDEINETNFKDVKCLSCFILNKI